MSDLIDRQAAKIEYQAIIQYIQERPIDIPFTGTADETFLWLQGYREAVNRIISYLGERMKGEDNATD